MNSSIIQNPDLIQFVKDFLNDMELSFENLAVHPIPQDGSSRAFFRLQPHRSKPAYILMINPPKDPLAKRENHAYLMIGNHLRDKGLPLPQIYHVNMEAGWFILQDMGEVNLQEMVSRNGDPIALLERVLDVLLELQIRGSEGFDPAWTCQTEVYDRFVMRRYEAEYFTDAFLGRYLNLKEEWSSLDIPFARIAEGAVRAEPCFFLHRDFQSRNILLSEGKLGIIDWQGGRLGPLAYDLASLLIDPYTGLTDPEINHLFQYYVTCLGDYNEDWADQVIRSYPYLAIQRNLQILGAFSFLSRVRKKTLFERYIPPALISLKALLDRLEERELNPLTKLVDGLLDQKMVTG